MKAKKSFGQHFLHREDLAQKICNSVHVESGRILEVGPGKGVLTKYLIKSGFDFKCVEADADMVLYLNEHYPELQNSIIEMDFLKLKLDQVFEDLPFTLIGNFPYNISSQIVFKMLEYKEFVPEMVGMFQKEMAVRIIAEHGNKDYGIISVLTQAYYEGKMLFSVSPTAFNPPPKVNSGVIKLVRRQEPLVKGSYKIFRMIVKTSFNQRRKMLRNTLKPLVESQDVLKDSFYDQRPEQLSVKEFVRMSEVLEEHIVNHIKNIKK